MAVGHDKVEEPQIWLLFGSCMGFGLGYSRRSSKTSYKELQDELHTKVQVGFAIAVISQGILDRTLKSDPNWSSLFGPYLFKSLRLRPPTPEAYGKTADFGTLCIPGSSQRLDPNAALLSSRPQPARCIECHADSLSCPLT